MTEPCTGIDIWPHGDPPDDATTWWCSCGSTGTEETLSRAVEEAWHHTTTEARRGGDVTTHDYVLRVLGVFERCDLYEGLSWRVKDGTVSFAAWCNDVFYWGTADCEAIDLTDLDLLVRCADDLEAADRGDGGAFLCELFAARKRGMRPQQPWGRRYEHDAMAYVEDQLDPAVRALFDAAGPVRDRRTEG